MYPDASLLVSAFSTEVSSEIAREWLASLRAGEILTSKWCETEIASGFAIKARRGELSGSEAFAAVDRTRRMLAGAATFCPIEPAHFDAAIGFVQQSEKALRGGDALHLAVASFSGATVWTLDRKMAEAGAALGLGTRLLT